MSEAAAALATDPAAAPAAATGTPGANDPAAASWIDSISDTDTKTWVQAKGWKDPAGLAASAYNLEKLIGHDRAGRTVVLPGENASQEEMIAFRAKMGIPEKPEAYYEALNPLIPGDEATRNVVAELMHKHGVKPQDAAAIAEGFSTHAAAIQAAQDEQFAQQSTKEYTDTLSKWGKDADANVELSRRFARQMIPGTAEERQEVLDKIERAIGTGKMLEMFANAGKSLGEARFAGEGSTSFGMSPAEAQAKITSLRNDKTWTSAYLAGDKSKLEEMQRLIAIANPEQ